MRKRTGLLKRIEKIEQQRSPRRPVFVWRELDETAEAESGTPQIRASNAVIPS